MFSRLVIAAAVVSLAAPASASGLQSSLETALTGLQAAETSISVLGNNPANSNTVGFRAGEVVFAGQFLPTQPLEIRPLPRPLGPPSEDVPRFFRLGPPNEVPEDALFVDPVSTTFGEAVYSNGPELIYDRSTGDLSVQIPPLLGPPDTFGNRQPIQPTGVTLFFPADLRGSAPRVPEIATFTPAGPLEPRTASSPFFSQRVLNPRQQSAVNTGTFPIVFNALAPTPTVINGRDQLLIDFENQRPLEIATLAGPEFVSRPDFTGFEVRVPQLVVEGLVDEQFLEPQPSEVPTGSGLFVLTPSFVERLRRPLPPIGALVDYNGGSDGLFELGFRLSDDQPGFTFLATARVVPEPAAALLLILGTASLPRRPRR